ncbi:Uncharacterized protein conserved in bacteria [Chlamydia trachomatis]|nr:Uncharacterized protein conserved in bacteria [Chlamydia trachomatis]CRH90978.1 Uncharacterized protein conserved in bacteria [Chlamydia trachomatis]
MKQLSFDLEKLQDLKIYLTRKNIELTTAALIVLCIIVMFLERIPTKTSLTLDNGKITYTGYTTNHKLTGQGKVTFENGDVYQGQFKNGLFHGQGTFRAKAGWTYTGAFSNGRPNGQGKLKTEDKTIYQGKFKQGIYQDEN